MCNFFKLNKLKNKQIKVVIMKKPKFNIFEHVYDRYGIEYIITDRVLAKDDYIYKLRDIDNGIDCQMFEFDLFKKNKKTG